MLPVLKLTGDGSSDIDFLYDVNISAVQRAAFRLLWRLFTAHAQFRQLQLPTKNLTSYLNSAQLFFYKDADISGARHRFRWFFDDDICACTVVH